MQLFDCTSGVSFPYEKSGSSLYLATFVTFVTIPKSAIFRQIVPQYFRLKWRYSIFALRLCVISPPWFGASLEQRLRSSDIRRPLAAYTYYRRDIPRRSTLTLPYDRGDYNRFHLSATIPFSTVTLAVTSYAYFIATYLLFSATIRTDARWIGNFSCLSGARSKFGAKRLRLSQKNML